MDRTRDDRNKWNSGRRLKKENASTGSWNNAFGATFRATRKVMGSQITQQVALQVIGNDTARAWRSQSHRLNEGGGSTDYRPRPGAASTAVAEDLAPLPPVAASTSPSLRSATDPPPHSSRGLRSRNWLGRILAIVSPNKESGPKSCSLRNSILCHGFWILQITQ